MSSTTDPRRGLVRAIINTVSRYGVEATSEDVDRWTSDVLDVVGADAPEATTGFPAPDEQRRREIALDQAARVATGRETQEQLVQRAQAFEAFLRGDALAAVMSAHVEGGDLDVLEILLGFIRERTFEDASGLRSLEGVDVQAEAESILVDLTHEQLRMMAHVLGVASTLVRSAERRRS